ncbi:MAG: asparaginase [Solirubrobacteraceae bacterium]
MGRAATSAATGSCPRARRAPAEAGAACTVGLRFRGHGGVPPLPGRVPEAPPRGAFLTRVVVLRGAAEESEHRVAWCLVRADGSAEGPDPELPVFARSAVKPLQALGSVRAGVLERFGLGDLHLALACASHGGSAVHVDGVAEVLDACGLVEGALGCGPDLPLDARELDGVRPSRIRHNCSGKHAFGLARCLVEDWPLDGYFRAGHPLQRAMRDCVVEACNVAAPTQEATDGCGMRTFAVPLAALARSFGALAGGGLGPAGDRCAGAMRAHPELVAYDGAIDTELMRAQPGLVAKIGAEGVLAIGLADGRGLALKVRDGSVRAVAPAGVALARSALGLDVAVPESLAVAPIINSRGVRGGELRAMGD